MLGGKCSIRLQLTSSEAKASCGRHDGHQSSGRRITLTNQPASHENNLHGTSLLAMRSLDTEFTHHTAHKSWQHPQFVTAKVEVQQLPGYETQILGQLRQLVVTAIKHCQMLQGTNRRWESCYAVAISSQFHKASHESEMVCYLTSHCIAAEVQDIEMHQGTELIWQLREAVAA